MSDRQEKISGVIKEISASYIARQANQTSLITITNVNISSDLKKATLFITVIPEDKEGQALHFIERNLGDIRGELKKMNIKTIPFLDVKIDVGEKERQKIDILLDSNK